MRLPPIHFSPILPSSTSRSLCKMQHRKKVALYKITSGRNFRSLASAWAIDHVHTLFILSSAKCVLKIRPASNEAAFPMTDTAFTRNNLISLLSPLSCSLQIPNIRPSIPADHHAPLSIQQRRTVETLTR